MNKFCRIEISWYKMGTAIFQHSCWNLLHTSSKTNAHCHWLDFNRTILLDKMALKFIPFVFKFSINLNQIKSKQNSAWFKNETEVNEQFFFWNSWMKTTYTITALWYPFKKQLASVWSRTFYLRLQNVFVETWKRHNCT